MEGYDEFDHTLYSLSSNLYNRTWIDSLSGSIDSRLDTLEGYDVVWVDREEGFFEILKESNPDLILMDVHLRFGSRGEINGFDLLNKYQMEPCLQKTKVIMISGMDLREKSKKAGADDFIIKLY